MPSLAQVRDKVNAWLSNHWSLVTDRQQAYFDVHGRYAQFLWSHTFRPAHDSNTDGDAKPDNLNNRLTDQAETWLDRFGEFDGVAIPMRVRFDVYKSPEGDGYVATVEVLYDGTIYSRSQNVGPLTSRTVGWHVVEEDEV